MSVAAVFGAGGAIGHALVERLAASGRYQRIHAGSRRSCSDFAPCVSPFTFDLTDEASIAAAMGQIDHAPELVILSSGLLHDAARTIAPEKSLRAIDAAAMARVLAVNTIGPALIAKHILPRLPRDRRAVFAVLSARVGSIGDNRLGGWHAYRASKAALNMLIANFAIEMRRTHPHAILVALHPGTVDSALSAPFQGAVAPGKLFTAQTAAAHLMTVIDGLTTADSGGFFAWDGARVPW
ncbi:SDR family NAD(P)-dependent oxidoreductase [Novosphingobium sediminicola]|uniref:NAD(P)-dependent dehydrogenase (Short-subunit alcohol dehydrogenase family) n=1 Tax=Novosphingobium sediminicola TaxID=563162 RepID=A0A7W6CFI7_9SPHN|nr:SDR family NAD(P)-dependent oxidoreductase [Novosphingobium sediminicola]MBB3955608.1 NAD(P)-dependent dehydrogenase (short-subunit alcohol dehydrogenase family) [Novosphingobium sediminicola]